MSVKEYLLSSQLHHTDLNFTFNEKLAHKFISQTCLVFLLQLDKHDSLHPQKVIAYPLAQYAAENWTFHAHTGGKDVLIAIEQLTTIFFQSDHPFHNWIELWDADDENDGWSHSTKSDSPLYYAALLGIQE